MTDPRQMVADALKGSWVHRFLPESLWPYAQLARWERPIGWWLLMWPCWWSAAMAVGLEISLTRANPDPLIGESIILIAFAIYLALFMAGAFIMRGAGCTYNDLVDQNIDDKVARTRSRPLPSGRVSRKNAWIFLGLQLFVGLMILLVFNWTTVIIGLISVITIIIYPFMKRITWWPQLFLGLAFSWGALVGWTSIPGALHLPAMILYLGCIFWVIGYDTIYALQDIEDDALVGVKSTARLFGANAKFAVSILYIAAIYVFALAFWKAGVNWPAWVGIVLGACHMVWQVKTLDINNPAICLKLFKSNSHFGWIIFAGLLAALFV